jgi:RNA polymerase sigma-70 factor, ECF subfamily
MLYELLNQLPPEQTLVIKLDCFYGMAHSQIAELLDLALGTVKSRVRIGMQNLKKLWLESENKL